MYSIQPQSLTVDELTRACVSGLIEAEARGEAGLPMQWQWELVRRLERLSDGIRTAETDPRQLALF